MISEETPFLTQRGGVSLLADTDYHNNGYGSRNGRIFVLFIEANTKAGRVSKNHVWNFQFSFRESL